jgi:DNA-binding NtrC family response regulator
VDVRTVLITDDEPEVRNYLGLALSCEGYKVEFAENGAQAITFLERNANGISVLLLDLVMPGKDGFSTLKEVRHSWPGLPVITISGMSTPANIASVMRDGAIEFLIKPVSNGELLRAVQSALQFSTASGIAGGKSVWKPATYIRSARRTWSQGIEPLLDRLGSSDVPVLLRGETGVGKEVLARNLHERSSRAGQPFLKLNCAALPTELVESELFGYERGAFTGAYKTTPGKFEMANNGTILLDEIGDMDFKLQAKLLQVLQDQEFLRLGAKNTSRIDVRVMAATHCDLETAMREGRFREDLYYRLNIVEIHVPPLRERKDEIIDLSESFLRKHSLADPAELPAQLQQALLEYDWPGNVRELENVIRRFLVFRNAEFITGELRRKTLARVSSGSCNSPTSPSKPVLLTAEHQSARVAPTTAEPQDKDYPLMVTSGVLEETGTLRAQTERAEPSFTGDAKLDVHDSLRRLSVLAQVDEARKTAEVEAIVAALNSTLWNRKQAAKLLKIDYKALLYKMKKLSIGTTPGAQRKSTSKSPDS